jgi:hypothetical protein
MFSDMRFRRHVDDIKLTSRVYKKTPCVVLLLLEDLQKDAELTVDYNFRESKDPQLCLCGGRGLNPCRVFMGKDLSRDLGKFLQLCSRVDLKDLRVMEENKKKETSIFNLLNSLSDVLIRIGSGSYQVSDISVMNVFDQVSHEISAMHPVVIEMESRKSTAHLVKRSMYAVMIHLNAIRIRAMCRHLETNPDGICGACAMKFYAEVCKVDSVQRNTALSWIRKFDAFGLIVFLLNKHFNSKIDNQKSNRFYFLSGTMQAAEPYFKIERGFCMALTKLKTEEMGHVSLMTLAEHLTKKIELQGSSK